MTQFRMRLAVEQNQVHAPRALGVIVDNFVERPAVLALEINLGGRAGRVEAGDFRHTGDARDGRRDVNVARVQLEQPAAHARTAEYQRRAALHDVERAVLPRLDSPRVGLGADDEVGRARTVEELRDALVSVGMAQHVGLEVRAIGIVGMIAAARGGVEFVGDGGDEERILIGDRILADLLHHLKGERAACVGEALEANHPAARPHFVGVGAPGDREIDVVGLGLGEHREDGGVAGIVLMRIEPIAGEPFGSEFARLIGIAIHLFSESPCQKTLLHAA